MFKDFLFGFFFAYGTFAFGRDITRIILHFVFERD